MMARLLADEPTCVRQSSTAGFSRQLGSQRRLQPVLCSGDQPIAHRATVAAVRRRIERDVGTRRHTDRKVEPKQTLLPVAGRTQNLPPSSERTLELSRALPLGFGGLVTRPSREPFLVHPIGRYEMCRCAVKRSRTRMLVTIRAIAMVRKKLLHPSEKRMIFQRRIVRRLGAEYRHPKLRLSGRYLSRPALHRRLEAGRIAKRGDPFCGTKDIERRLAQHAPPEDAVASDQQCREPTC